MFIFDFSEHFSWLNLYWFSHGRCRKSLISWSNFWCWCWQVARWLIEEYHFLLLCEWVSYSPLVVLMELFSWLDLYRLSGTRGRKKALLMTIVTYASYPPSNRSRLSNLRQQLTFSWLNPRGIRQLTRRPVLLLTKLNIHTPVFRHPNDWFESWRWFFRWWILVKKG